MEEKRLMIQSLLADRFKLTMHYEMRELPEYALVVAKSGKTGPQLRPHSDSTTCVDVPAGQPYRIVPGATLQPSCRGIRVIDNDLAGRNVTITRIAEALSVLVGRNVVNRTGLDGTFDVTLHFQILPLEPDASAFDPSGPPSIFIALQEQLGLKLESQKGAVDVQVIDHVEEPSPN